MLKETTGRERLYEKKKMDSGRDCFRMHYVVRLYYGDGIWENLHASI